MEKPNTVPAEEELSDGLELLPLQQANQALVLHPQYRDKIRAHQEEGIRFLERNLVQDEPNGCILAHAPGTGKSFLIIAFLQSFQTSFPDERPLIIAPNGMLSVWVREFQKWKVEDIPIFNLYEAPSLQEQDDNDNRVLSQRRYGQLEMLHQWKAQKSVLLVGYPTFSRLVSGNDAPFFLGIKRLLLEVPGLLILDEGHFPRNKDTLILKSLSQVQTRRRVLLTGTLFQNNFDELFNLYYLVRPDFMTLNASCTKRLLEDYMKANSSPAKMKSSPSSKGSKQRSRKEDMELRLFENLGETIKLGDPEKKRQAISQLRQLSEPFVHLYKGQVLEELPGLIDLTLILKMTCMQAELLSTLQAKVENQLDRSIKSTKICIHPSLVNMVTDDAHNNELAWKDCEVDPNSSAKMMFVLDLLQLATPQQEKVLLFSQLLDPFQLLEKMLKKLWGWCFNKEILKIEGQTSLEERESVIDRFNQDPKTRILFASIKTCGEGVSLIGASRIVLLDVQWNPMVSRQAISRAFRIGQKRKVFVYRLVGGGALEEHAHMKASEKEWLAKQIFEGCHDDDYSAYCHEVNPQEVDTYFESRHLRENVLKCFRYHFV